MRLKQLILVRNGFLLKNNLHDHETRFGVFMLMRQRAWWQDWNQRKAKKLSWRKAMEEKERAQKNVIMEEKERRRLFFFFFWVQRQVWNELNKE